MQLYTWEVTHKKQTPTGPVPFTMKQTGPKPPKGAKNIQRVGAGPADNPAKIAQLKAELAALEEKEASEQAKRDEQHAAELAHKERMAAENKARADALRTAAEPKPTPAAPAAIATVEIEETVTHDIDGKPIINSAGEPLEAVIDTVQLATVETPPAPEIAAATPAPADDLLAEPEPPKPTAKKNTKR